MPPRWEPDRTFDVTIAYSAFLPGAFLRESGASEIVQFLALEARFLF